MVRKYGRYGEFVACSSYPTCKYVKQKTIGVKCPNCSEGEVVERRSKRGKTFYGCNRYPDCDFVAWGKPIPEKCPDCGSGYLIEKFLKAGPMAQCPNAECKFKKPLPPVVEAAKPEEPVEVEAPFETLDTEQRPNILVRSNGASRRFFPRRRRGVRSSHRNPVTK